MAAVPTSIHSATFFGSTSFLVLEEEEEVVVDGGGLGGVGDGDAGGGQCQGGSGSDGALTVVHDNSLVCNEVDCFSEKENIKYFCLDQDKNWPPPWGPNVNTMIRFF